jgi:gluconolactonase
VDIRDDRFTDVVGSHAEVEPLVSGFGFIEGPIWDNLEGHLTFSDIPNNEMLRWHPNGKLSVYRRPSNMANGNAYDRDGRILSCEHATSRVTRTEKDGSTTVLANLFQGKELNSPNDIIVARNGMIYFSDPSFGRNEYFGIAREQDLSFQGVYRVAPDGSNIELIADDFGQPNGLCFSNDSNYLYVNDTENGHIRRFDVSQSGAVSGGAIWAVVSGVGDGAPDGLKVDTNDNVYCTGPGGVHVFAPDATCLGVIRLPEVVANFTWGGDDLKTMLFTASTTLYRAKVATPGAAVF